MKAPERKRDLAIVVADQDQQEFLNGLLSNRHTALKIRKLSVDWKSRRDVIREPNRDSGVLRNGPALLETLRDTHEHGLLVLDADFAGSRGAPAIQKKLEAAAQKTWGKDAAVIVLNPELETWAFTGSEKLAEHLEWDKKRKGSGFTEWLAGQALVKGKPSDPKSVLIAAGAGARRHDPRWWYELGAKPINFSACKDAAFLTMQAALLRWFPIDAPS